MYYEQVPEGFLFYILYGATAAMYAIACVYLLFRRGNAFATDVTTSLRLRRWTAVCFGASMLSHLWYLPAVFLTSPVAVQRTLLLGGMLDCLTVLPLDLVVLLCMLQDRRRPLWLPFVAVLPLGIIMAVGVVEESAALQPWWLAYMSLLSVCFLVYMIRATRQYGLWLRDNYADLEHKEVWQNILVMAAFLLVYAVYSINVGGMLRLYIIHICDVLMIGYLLWRVETLSDLSLAKPHDAAMGHESVKGESLPADSTKSSDENITALLQQHCEATGLYLHHDLTAAQLSKAVGINRYYLSQYFSRRGITYNAYVNELRIRHFIRLYREAVAQHCDFTIKQLASDSGYQSYSTFSLAFKQLMGQNVSTWQREQDEA